MNNQIEFNEKKEGLVSVVIPTYNRKATLERAILSVLSQTYTDWELIIVDDGSTDDSLKILHDFARKDDRIQVRSKENEHVSIARNYALERACGEYVLFLDSDDWLELETIEIAVQTAQEQSADVVLWSYVREMGTESRRKHIFCGDIVFEPEMVRNQLYRRLVGPVGEEAAHPENMDTLSPSWGKLYRTALIRDNHVAFYDIRQIGTFEDGLFNIELFSHVQKAVFLDRYFYHYRRDNNDSLTRINKPKLPEQWDNLYQLITKHVDDRDLDDSFHTALSNRIALNLVGLGTNEMESEGSAGSKIGRIRELLSKPHYRTALKKLDLAPLPIHWKIFFLGAMVGCAWSVYLLLLVIQKIRGR